MELQRETKRLAMQKKEVFTTIKKKLGGHFFFLTSFDFSYHLNFKLVNLLAHFAD